MKASAGNVAEFKEGAGPASLWAGALAGPLAALTQLQVNYALVRWACDRGIEWSLHVVALVALLVTLAAALLSWRNWWRAGGGFEDGGAGVLPRSRFMALVGLMLGLLSALVVVAQWIPVFLYNPCDR